MEFCSFHAGEAEFPNIQFKVIRSEGWRSEREMRETLDIRYCSSKIFHLRIPPFQWGSTPAVGRWPSGSSHCSSPVLAAKWGTTRWRWGHRETPTCSGLSSLTGTSSVSGEQSTQTEILTKYHCLPLQLQKKPAKLIENNIRRKFNFSSISEELRSMTYCIIDRVGHVTLSSFCLTR